VVYIQAYWDGAWAGAHTSRRHPLNGQGRRAIPPCRKDEFRCVSVDAETTSPGRWLFVDRMLYSSRGEWRRIRWLIRRKGDMHVRTCDDKPSFKLDIRGPHISRTGKAERASISSSALSSAGAIPRRKKCRVGLHDGHIKFPRLALCSLGLSVGIVYLCV
jgi:hypothetical protein